VGEKLEIISKVYLSLFHNTLTQIDPFGLRCSAKQLRQNRINGKKAEQLILDRLNKNPNVTVLGQQVYVKTKVGGRFVDILIRNNKGQMVAVEVKAGNATRSASQLAKDRLISQGNGMFGNSAPSNLAGQSTTGVIISEARVPLWRIP